MAREKYDSGRLKDFYNYDRQFGALFNDNDASQYGIKSGNVIGPVRYYFFHDKLLNIICSNISQSSILLDVGCGRGLLAETVCDKVKLYVGVDISIERIKQRCKDFKSGKVYFVVADAEHLPFKNASFNMATAIEVIEHVPDTRLFLQEINRVLADRSIFALSTPGNLVFKNNIDLLCKDPHLYEFSPRKLRKVLEDNSFKVDSITGVGFKSPMIKIYPWLGSDVIKYMYKRIKGAELKAGYGSPITLQFDLATNSLFRIIYLAAGWKRPLKLIMEIFDFFGRHIPALSSTMVAICRK